MSETRTQGLVVGVLMLGAGLFYLSLASELPRRGTVDASTIPFVLAGAMVLLAVLQLLVAWRKPRVAPALETQEAADEDALPPGRPSYATVAATLGLVALYTASLRLLGFPLATFLYLLAQFVVLTPAGRRPPSGLYALIAASSAVIIFAAFRYGFELLLPAGPLTPFLP